LLIFGLAQTNTASATDDFWIKTNVEDKGRYCQLLKIKDAKILCSTGTVTYSFPLSTLETVSITLREGTYTIEDITEDKYKGLTTAITNIYNAKMKVVARARRAKLAKEKAYKNTYAGGRRFDFGELLDLFRELPKEGAKLLDASWNSCIKELDKHVTDKKECTYYKLVGHARIVNRGNTAEVKIDNGDWTTASELRGLIEDQVERDMYGLFD